jgi:hypothetical protein
VRNAPRSLAGPWGGRERLRKNFEWNIERVDMELVVEPVAFRPPTSSIDFTPSRTR